MDIDPVTAPFGTVFGPKMAASRFIDGSYQPLEMVAPDDISVHPAAHVLHYGSSCFEGLKAHRQVDGSVKAFRPARHAQRLLNSAARLRLPEPEFEMVLAAINSTVEANASSTPYSPGSLYLRPVIIGTERNIGAAGRPAKEAIFYVLASPVGPYFAGGSLTLVVETDLPRTTPQFGSVKTGANYAMALGLIERAAAEYGADQVLFAPGGQVEETGASNIIVVHGDTITTPALTDGFLHGVTRESLLELAPTLGYTVDERTLALDELLSLISANGCEVLLTGTAAVVSPVGTLIHAGVHHYVAGADANMHAARLRNALVAIQTGVNEAPSDWP